MINIMINEYIGICFSLNFVLTFYIFILLNYAHPTTTFIYFFPYFIFTCKLIHIDLFLFPVFIILLFLYIFKIMYYYF